ncbi:MAG: GlsB/YeaQ/YmgE family stress response membrane protein [Sphingomonadaceae bacterium]|nr:GlsB/YeaQ/YmgE family stress response membrane protein [Sphingomonadaceae bacterium]
MHAMTGESLLIAFIIWIVVGAIIGWLAGVLVQGGGFGFIADALIGIFGSVVAGWLFPQLGVPLGGGLVGSVLASIVGAIIVIVVIRLLRRI